MIILVSLAVGIATHIAWDGFAHRHGWAVAIWPGMVVPLFFLRHHPFEMYELMQYGGTAFGAMVLMVAAARWYRRAPEDENLPPQLSRAVSATICFVMVATAVIVGALIGMSPSHALALGLSNLVRTTVGFVITTTSVAAIELFGFSLIWRLFLAGDQSGGAVEAVHHGHSARH